MSNENVDFSQFIISLAHGALVGLGEIPDPETKQTQQNLAMAKHSFGVLTILQHKTKGNLEEQEQNLLDALVKDLQEKLDSAAQK